MYYTQGYRTVLISKICPYFQMQYILKNRVCADGSVAVQFQTLWSVSFQTVRSDFSCFSIDNFV